MEKRKRVPSREIKRSLSGTLKSDDPESVLGEIKKLKPSLAVNSLFSFLYNNNAVIKWNAVMSMGESVSRIADKDMESARTIIRRLMWNLNDESGGIGWGSPEAMGEILAGNDDLAEEYHRILLSYASKDGNFQENEYIQRGLLWGIGRLASKRPDLVREASPYLIGFLDSPDPVIRGYAAQIMGLIGDRKAYLKLQELKNDMTEIQVNMDRRLVTRKVKNMAEEALERLDGYIK